MKDFLATYIMKVINIWKIVLSTLVFMSLFTHTPIVFGAQAIDTITFAFSGEPSKHPAWRSAELIYTEAFHRIGMEFRYEVYPTKRSSIMVNTGQVDGEPGRTADYNKTFTNLIRVEETIAAGQITAYAVNSDIALEDWESLRDAHYQVNYLRGALLEKQHLLKVVDRDKLATVTEPIQGFKKLAAGYADIFVSENLSIRHFLTSTELKNSGIRDVCNLQEIFVYPYLHKRHIALSPKLAAALKQMKVEGLLQHYNEQASKEFEPAITMQTKTEHLPQW